MTILVIGATGMLGRPVVRRLVRHGLAIRAFVRDEARARAMLPAECELAIGDLRDETSLERAMHGVDAVYANLNTPFDQRSPYDPDRDGTAAIVRAMQVAGVDRFVRISAMGVPEATGEWWAIDRKARTDKLVMASPLRWTIFRPTWFMESLPLFAIGRRWIVRFGTPRTGLWWIAGDDYARMVGAAMSREEAVNQVYIAQGPEQVSLRDAVARLARATRPRRRVLPVPRSALRCAALALAKPRYLNDLFDISWKWTTDFRGEAAHAFARPRMTIQDYAQYVESNDDWPRK